MAAADVTERVPATEHAGASITGRCRDVNQGGWAALPRLGVYFVVDGCSGDAPGRLAADLAVQSVERLSSADSTVPVELLALAIEEANAQFNAVAKGKSLGMGATIAALRFAPPWVVTASVGDCRVYRYRRGSGPEHARADRVLARLTTDDLLWVALLP